MSPKLEKLVLALNAGSSSLKASVIQARGDVGGEEVATMLVSFLAERLTTADAVVHISPAGKPKVQIEKEEGKVLDHSEALRNIIDYLDKNGMMSNLVAVGHRVVHGGSIFKDSALITDQSIEQIDSVSHLAPLHNPHNVAGIRAMRALRRDIPNIAVFDTSFHATIPVRAYTYPLPSEYRAKEMRKYGFHGTSVRYVSQKAAKILQALLTTKSTTHNNNDKSFQMVVCHLGNGASVTAVSGDKSMETSMGFTPLSGLMMGTRCGDVDPSLVSFACHQLNKDVDEVLNDFNKRSGLKGMIRDGESDMRELLARAQNGDQEAELAVEMFVYRLAQHIAQCLVALKGPLDAIVFTAGIGEHSSEIRRRTVTSLANILPNLTLDQKRNEVDGKNSNGIISVEGAWPVALDIPTDEEAMIAKECIRLVDA